MIGSPVERALIAQTFPGGASSDGIIRYSAECHCRGCGQGAMGLTYSAATTELKDMGWRKLDRNWFCRNCAPNYLAARAKA